MREHNIKQKDVAAKVGVLPCTINRWMSNPGEVTIVKLQLFVEALGMKLSDLILMIEKKNDSYWARGHKQ